VTDTNRYAPTAARSRSNPDASRGGNRPPSTSFACRRAGRRRDRAAASRSRNRSLAHYATAKRQALNAKQEQDRRTRIDGLDNASMSACATWTTWAPTCSLHAAPAECYYTVPVRSASRRRACSMNGIAAYVAAQAGPFRRARAPCDAGRQGSCRRARSAMKTLGFKGAQVLTNVGGKELSDPAFAPFCGQAEGARRADRDSSQWFLRKRALRQILLQQRHRQSAQIPRCTALPDLSMACWSGTEAEDPGRARAAIWRAYSGRIRSRLGRAHRTWRTICRKPRRAIQAGYFDTVVFTEHQLEYLIKVFGRTTSSWAPTIRSTWQTTIRSGHVTGTESVDAKTIAAICGGTREVAGVEVAVGWLVVLSQSVPWNPID